MESTAVKKKWYNWRIVVLVIIVVAIFIKFFVLEEKEKNEAPLIVELDLNNVARRTAQEVEAVLGKGKLDSYYRDETIGCEKCPKMIYKEGKIEIIFVDEAADRITLKNLSDYEFDDRVILGLLNFKSETKPSLDQPTVKRWDNFEKYSQIAAFSKGNKIEYIAVKTRQN